MRNIFQIHHHKSQKSARFSCCFGIARFSFRIFEGHSHRRIFRTVFVHFACRIFHGPNNLTNTNKIYYTYTHAYRKNKLHNQKCIASSRHGWIGKCVCALNINNCMAWPFRIIISMNFLRNENMHYNVGVCLFVCVFLMNTLIWLQSNPLGFFWADFSSVRICILYIDFTRAFEIPEVAKKSKANSSKNHKDAENWSESAIKSGISTQPCWHLFNCLTNIVEFSAVNLFYSTLRKHNTTALTMQPTLMLMCPLCVSMW